MIYIRVFHGIITINLNKQKQDSFLPLPQKESLKIIKSEQKPSFCVNRWEIYIY